MKAKPQHTLQLSRAERGELIVEAIITLGVIFFLYLGLVLLYRELIDRPFTFWGETASIQQRFEIRPAMTQVFLYGSLVSTIVIGGLFTNWRIQRRIHQMQLSHILDELKYIAKGNYHHRIPEVDKGDMSEVINSINHLVDSTVEAMEEERRIEKSKDELVSNIGHDIRTPLTSIIGYLGLIENEQYQSQDELLFYTHTAYNKAVHMQKLVNDLFDYTALRQTTTTIAPQRVQLELFLQQVCADFEETATQNGIRLGVHVAPDAAVVYFDADKMARVFSNLLSNALKYGAGATEINIAAQRTPTSIQFEVKNNGDPIQEAELTAIFERSYRADKSRTSEQAGSGLGLAIVKNIIELHQGTVIAEIRGNWTCFCMSIPQQTIDK